MPPRRALRASWRLLLALGLLGGGGAAWRGADVSTAEEPLRVFVYDLPGRFHGGLVEEHTARYRAAGGTCDFMQTACTETRWIHGYSEARWLAGEVIILRKFMQSGLLVDDPRLADVFLVPYLAATDCRLTGNLWRCPFSALAHEVFEHLPHYGQLTRHRHLFLGTADVHSLPLVIQSQTLLLSYGAKPGHVVGPVVVPPAVVDPMLQPSAWEGGDTGAERDILLWLAGAHNNPVRMEIFNQLEVARDNWRSLSTSFPGERGSVVVIRSGRNYVQEASKLPPHREMIPQMRRAQLCPVVPAENSAAGTKRLFDVVLAGCLPVVIAFRTALGSGVSWWRQNGAPVEWSLPFPGEVDWRRLAIEVPAEALRVHDFSFVSAALSVSHEEREAKRRYLREVRHLLSYDMAAAGGGRDAFVAILSEVRQALGLLGARPSNTVCNFIPRVIGIREIPSSFMVAEGQDVGKQKEWSQTSTEVSCQPAALWRDTKAEVAGFGRPPVRIERYTTFLRAATRGAENFAGVVLRTLEARERGGLLAMEDLTASAYTACHRDVNLVACHDVALTLQDGNVGILMCADFWEGQLQGQAEELLKNDTTCRLLPDPAWMPLLPGTSLQLELVTHACRQAGTPADYAAVLSDFVEVAWSEARGRVPAELAAASALQVVAYETCAESPDPGGWRSDAAGVRALAEHVLAGILAAERRGVEGAGLADYLVLAPGLVNEGGEWRGLPATMMSSILATFLQHLHRRGPGVELFATFHVADDPYAVCCLWETTFSEPCPDPQGPGVQYGPVIFHRSLLPKLRVSEWEIAAAIRTRRALNVHNVLVMLLHGPPRARRKVVLMELDPPAPREPEAELPSHLWTDEQHVSSLGGYMRVGVDP